ncbi:MAG: diguanylate cyclase [Rhodoferax sp.]|nr:diguanylate cyclase [Rhodoferax sp.]
MIQAISQWGEAPVFNGDEEKSRRAGLLNQTILINLFFTGLVIFGALIGRHVPTGVLLIATLWFVLLLLSRRLLRSGKSGMVEGIVVLVFFVLLTLTNINLGSVRTPMAAVYVFWVTLIGTLYRRPGILVAMCVSSLTILVLILAENSGLLPRVNDSVGVTQWLLYTALFGMTGSLAYYTNQTTQRALARSKNEIEQRKRAEAELRKLTRAVEQSPASIVITDLTGTIEYVNPRFTKVTGYQFDEVVGRNPRMLKTDQTKPGSHNRMWETLSAGGEWQGEFVNRKKDGSLYYEWANISPITDIHGVATHYLAVKEDITERKWTEEALRASEKRHRVLADNARDVVWTMAPGGMLTYVSPSIMDVRGFTPFEAMQQTIEEIYTPASQVIAQGYLSTLQSDLEAGRTPPSFRGELEYRCNDGSTLWTEVMAHPLVNEHDIVEILGVTRDISEHKRLLQEIAQAKDATEAANQALQSANMELARLATTDTLTGVWNRRHFEEIANTERTRALRYKHALSLLILDIDHFKRINDSFGHPTGDQVLIGLTKLVGGALRQSDVLARWGGEEFVVIIPHCAASEAVLLAEKLCTLTAAHVFPDVGTVTASFGAAELKPDEPLEVWFKRVDLALYAAKTSGRNKVCLAP